MKPTRPMRVLWFTNIPMPGVQESAGREILGGGHWMSTLLMDIASTGRARLAVVTAYPGLETTHFSNNGVEYYLLGQPKHVPMQANRKTDLMNCNAVIREWKPDIVHIHGTERFYGLLASDGSLGVPFVISLQGLLSEIRKKYFGNLKASEAIRSQALRPLVRGRGFLLDYLRFCRAAQREKEIIAGAKNIVGRTQWDRAHVKSINPKANYFHVDELLRPLFYKTQWTIENVKPYSIIFSNAKSPLRGVETILEALVLLKPGFPQIKLRLAGGIEVRRGYGRFLRQRIDSLGLGDAVEFLGYLGTEDMVDALCSSHVFCIASYVENSPNSLCEAQLIGMPCVGSYAGGIPSLINHGKTGLLFSPGDSAVLAQHLAELFSCSDLAVTLGRESRAIALSRHSRDHVLDQLFDAYDACLSSHEL